MRGVISGVDKHLADACNIIIDPDSNVVADDLFIYCFNNLELQRKAISASTFEPFETLLPSDEPGTWIEYAKGNLYWGRFQSVAGKVSIFHRNPDPAELPELVITLASVGSAVKKMKLCDYSNLGAGVNGLAVLLNDGNLYRCNLTDSNVVLAATGISDFAVQTVYPLAGDPQTTIYASRGTT